MVVNQDRLLYQYRPIKDMLDYKEKEHGVSYGLSEAGYDIRIKQQIRFTTIRGKQYVLRTDVDHINGVVFPPVQTGGRFTLASAIEEFQMPTNLVGVVHDKSTWARQGLSVFNTVIEPGFVGGLTLELVYHGNKSLHIPAGSGIAQVVFHRTTDHARYSGVHIQ